MTNIVHNIDCMEFMREFKESEKWPFGLWVESEENENIVSSNRYAYSTCNNGLEDQV